MTMGTKYPEIFAALAAPFDSGEVKQRSEGGRTMRYITARTARNRLDDVIGPENWSDDPIPYMDGTGSFLCKLTITLPDGTKVTKSGVGGGKARGNQAGPSPPKDSESDAFKRAAEKFGIARYLYRDGVPKFVMEAVGSDEMLPQGGGQQHRPHHQPSDDGRRAVNETFRQQARGPDGGSQSSRRAESKWGGARPEPAQRPAGNGGGGDNFDDRPPTNGKQLFAWLRKRDEAHPGLNLIRSLNSWAQENELAGRIVDWPEEEIPGALAAAQYFLDQAEVPAS
jgi:hypothetical protein